MRAELKPFLPNPNPWLANRPALYGSAAVGLVVSCAAALAIALLPWHTVSLPGGQPWAPAASVAAPVANSDTSVPDASAAFRGKTQWEAEAPATF